MTLEITPITLSNSKQFYLENARGEKHLIQISWPLHWTDEQPPADSGPLPILYIVDGNALFLTATEAAWRRAVMSDFTGGGLIVAIGYPLTGTGNVYDFARRSRDLTPPASDPAVPGHGGADEFLTFVTDTVRPAVRAAFPRVTCARDALYGHSYGGLFALHALFTRPDAFDCYLASSPSIWWNGRWILEEARGFLDEERPSDGERVPPALMMFVGSWEQEPPQRRGESDDAYEERRRMAADWRMRDNALELGEMLRDCPAVHAVPVRVYEGEEHTSVMACSLNRGLTAFFEGWPFAR
ncbi:alpha/beta hydrolase [Aspergillus aculeatinus CBS 121060]|uniref:Hydrolase of the alpha/beta superfamily n=1 Tax=Aspergillus aculeatinus CBS 121060 TaxID=1448322 RepID=A0ACD1H899_9EURO|nr:putative hydrolase of the alpha/beta superfamily [Aspergillus aculeatinus CBS 121060]RAH69820.1 putative hydrolase of the alpha/beta superfamily [Aspergillus aculeatinus CBS 121060]